MDSLIRTSRSFSRTNRDPRASAPHLTTARYPFFIGLCGLSLLVSAVVTSGQVPHPTEFQVKAAYVYNFSKFVTWQMDDGASRAFSICVLGKDPFGPVLDSTVAGESVGGRPISVKRVSRISEASQCSILYVSSSEEGSLDSILTFAESSGILTVGDMPRFAERGGVIGFVSLQNRIRFEVNRGSAERSHLSLSSELLKVASRVIDPVGPGRQP